MNGNVIGQNAEVRFSSLDRTLNGKVDTGATTSSLNATNIKVNGNRVSFHAPELSNSILTLDVVGQQDVSSADGGTAPRVMIKLDVQINGVAIKDATFNLNDRSHMDSPLLIGQNLIKQGNFLVDIKKNPDDDNILDTNLPESEEVKIFEAIRVMERYNLSIADLLRYMRTEAINRIDE